MSYGTKLTGSLATLALAAFIVASAVPAQAEIIVEDFNTVTGFFGDG